jgi:Concanavalin A-like lectin/glucanases superfamily
MRQVRHDHVAIRGMSSRRSRKVTLDFAGVNVASQAQTSSLATSSMPLQIGGDSIYGQYFTGTIDEIRIYNRALSTSEIAVDMISPIH